MKTVLEGLGLLLGLLVVGVIVVAIALPPSAFLPPRLPTDAPLVVSSSHTTAPRAAVDIIYDERGVPHLFGDDERDLAYGLGFVHARDRLFQLDVLRHAALGRLSELFGEDLLDTDRRLRLVSFGVERQTAAMSPRDQALLESYVAGINDGARHAGTPLEMFILGTELEPFEPSHVVALARLQAWDLAFDLSSELFRERIRSALGDTDPRMQALMASIPSGGVPIVAQAAHSGAHAATLGEMRARLDDDLTVDKGLPLPPPENRTERGEQGHLDRSRFAPLRAALAAAFKPHLDALSRGGRGASNSWVVSGAHTKSGAPMLSNDPHLRHRLPSVFYLAHLELPDLTAVGATFPGLPAVLIGHTRHLAWGMTTSFVDGQDLVELDVTEDGTGYRIDGAIEAFETVEQVFALDEDPDGEEVREIWKVSRFGPVLSSGFERDHPDYDRFALKWVGYDTGPINRELLSTFWSLYRAKTIEEVNPLIAKLSTAGQNMALAFTDGTIAYRLASAVPIRASDASTHLPRDGSRSDADWLGYLSADYKPQLTNPAGGTIVSSNQRVVDDAWTSMRFAGGFGAMYHRAKRVDERLREGVERGGLEPSDFLDMQLDSTSVEARLLAPILGAACPNAIAGLDPSLVNAYCDAVRAFDGDYTRESAGALPYTTLVEALRVEVLVPIVGEEAAKDAYDELALRGAVESGVVAAAAGHASPLFDDDGYEAYVFRAAKRGVGRLVEVAGDDPTGWRWGAHHHLTPAHPLATVPLLGRLFSVEPRELSGYGETIQAEDRLPVTHGAALRFVAELTTPPRALLLLDAGNSGHSGSPHYADQREPWATAEPFALMLDREKLEEASAGRLRLVPAE